MRERFHLRQISKPVRESLLGRSKSREGYWRSVFEDLHVAPCLTFLHDKQQVPNQRHRDKAPLRKFSTMIKRMVVELDRDPALYSDGNIVEVIVFSAFQLLTDSVSKNSGQERLVIITQHWMVSPFEEQATYPRNFASYYIWKTFLNNIRFYRN
jgi:hypothetical protein